MRKIIYILFFFLEIAVSYAQVSIILEPKEVNASYNVDLLFNISNSGTTNLTSLNISFPSIFWLSNFDASGKKCELVASRKLSCQGTPLIESNSILLLTLSGRIDEEGMGLYDFIFEWEDEEKRSGSLNVSLEVKDVIPPLILSVSPPNNTEVFYAPQANYTFQIRVRDNVKVKFVEFIFERDLKDVKFVEAKEGQLNFTLSDLPTGEYRFVFAVRDESYNANVSDMYFFRVKKAPNPIDVYLGEKKNENITIVVNSTLPINISSKGMIFAFLNETLLFTPTENFVSLFRLFDAVGYYRLFVNSSGNQNYTENSTGVIYWIRVIYPRISYSMISAPSKEVYAPLKTYKFSVNFTSTAFPYNNITNVSFQLNDRIYYLPISNRSSQVFSFETRDLKAGDYTWQFCALDSQDERTCVGGSFQVEKAKPDLQILRVGDYLAPVNITVYAIGCPEQLSCNFYLNSTKLDNDFYDIISDKAGYYIFVYNTTGNENYTSAEVRGIVRVFLVGKKEEKLEEKIDGKREEVGVRKELMDFSANVPNVIDVERSQILKIRQIIVEVTKEEKNVRFEILQPSNLPQKMPPGIPFSFIEIVTNLTRENIKRVRFSFFVEKSWIQANNIDVSTISLYRWNGSEWEKVSTTKLSEDENYMYFEATHDRFSIFAISGEIAKSEFPWGSIIIIIVGILLAAFIIYLFWPTKSGLSEYDKLKKKIEEKTTP